MTDDVIEAAAKAALHEMERPGGGWNAHKVAESAIRAADRARAPEIIAAVEALEVAVETRYANSLKGRNEHSAYWGDEVERLRRDLLALFGIDDGEAVTGGE